VLGRLVQQTPGQVGLHGLHPGLIVISTCCAGCEVSSGQGHSSLGRLPLRMANVIHIL
jgi:hypothetical protein